MQQLQPLLSSLQYPVCHKLIPAASSGSCESAWYKDGIRGTMGVSSNWSAAVQGSEELLPCCNMYEHSHTALSFHK